MAIKKQVILKLLLKLTIDMTRKYEGYGIKDQKLWVVYQKTYLQHLTFSLVCCVLQSKPFLVSRA